MADVSRNTLRGLLIADPRLRDESAIWTAETTLTQAGARLTQPTTTDTTSWRMEARGKTDEAVTVQVVEAGVPGSGLGLTWKPASASDLRGRDAPVQIRGDTMIQYRDTTGTIVSADYPDAITLEDGTLVVVAEVTSSVTIGSLFVDCWTIDPATGEVSSSVRVHADTTASFGDLRPFLVRVPRQGGGERVLCGFWNQDQDYAGGIVGQIRILSSDDGGATWSDYASTALRGTTTIDGLTAGRDGIQIASAHGSGTSGWLPFRCRAAYANGQVLLMMHLQHADTDYQRMSDFLFQWSSADLGCTFQVVDEPTNLTATEDVQYRGGYPDVVARDGLFHVAYIDINDTAYATGGGAGTIVTGLTIARLGSSSQQFSAAGGNDSARPTGGQAETAQVGATTLYQLDDPEHAIVADDDGRMWAYYRQESTGEVRAAYSLDGVTWRKWGSSMLSSTYGNVWDVDSGGTQPLDGGGTGGITTEYPKHFAAAPNCGRVALVTNWNLDTSPHDNSLVALYLGGYHTQTLGWTSSAIRSPGSAVGWEDTWYHLNDPDDQQWTLSSSGTSTETHQVSGLLVTTTTGTRYWTQTPKGSGPEGVVARWVMECDSGASGDDRCAVRIKVRDGLYEVDVSIRYSATAVAVVDNVAASTLASVSIDMSTEAREFEVHVKLEGVSGEIALYQRPASGIADNAWTLLVSDNLTRQSNITAVHSIQWGHITSQTAISRWRMFCYVSNDFSGLKWRDAKINSPDDLAPLHGSARWVHTTPGAYMRAVDGPGIVGETYTLPLGYDYGAERMLPFVNASPDATWRSTDETQQRLALAYNPTTLGTEDAAPLGDTLAVYLGNINWSAGSLEGYVAGTGWSSIGSFDTSASYTYVGHGNVIELRALSFSRVVREGEWNGATVVIGSNEYRVVHTRGGEITGSAGSPRRCRLVLDSSAGTGSGAAKIVPRQAVIVWRNATDYAGLRVTIDAQSTAEGYFTIGALVVGPFYVFGQDYSWGRIIERSPNVDVSEGRGGQRRATRLGPQRRTAEVAWTDGIDVTQIDSATTTPDYLASTSTSAIEPIAFERAVGYDIDGIAHLIDGPLHPVVYLPKVAKGTGGAGDVEILTDVGLSVYGRVTSPVRLESILGDEEANEVWRLARLTIEEEV